ncbi:hypothetical protein BCR39DRAFT_555728 [Naematelia encephala]|uniref:TIGR04076 family protein n=1 Tax=Naematelia encephala TaxID=71784 RepID=A0A1Y2BLD6_9TREE|nr:hypothetical protein BCR39DRAFT_555728 [Naematelia encephala]
MSDTESTFQLFDLRVTVEAPADGSPLLCSSKPGDYLELKGEVLTLPANQGFSVYSLGALLPLLPAKQRALSKGDWMSREDRIACSDPACKSTMLIQRIAVSTFKQGENGVVELMDKKARAIMRQSSQAYIRQALTRLEI